jgi:DNA-binding response OmpR family regulator
MTLLDPEPVLVVAAEAEMRGMLAVAIAEETGRTVAAAPDAAEAVRLARARRPGVVVVDLGRDGEDGALRALRDESAIAGCAVVVTGPAASREAALEAGAVAFVAEPVDLKAVLAAVIDGLAAAEGVDSRAA